MEEALTVLALGGFAVLWCVGVSSWFAIVIYGYRAVRRARPGVDLWSAETMWNPANVLIRPGLLTDEGRVYRRKCFRAVGVFVACVTIPLSIAAVTGNLQ